MKIHEIVEAPEDNVDNTEPQDNVRPGSANTKSTGNDWTQAELTQMRVTYRNSPEFVNLVQVALMMPHIRTMQQAIMYANTELAARKSREPSKADIPDYDLSKTDYYEPTDSRAQRIRMTDPFDVKKASRGVSYAGDTLGGNNTDALDTVTGAAKTIAGKVANFVTGNDGSKDPEGSTSDKIGQIYKDVVGGNIAQGKALARKLS